MFGKYLLVIPTLTEPWFDNPPFHAIHQPCSNCSLSWLSFLGVGAGDPKPRTQVRGGAKGR